MHVFIPQGSLRVFWGLKLTLGVFRGLQSLEGVCSPLSLGSLVSLVCDAAPIYKSHDYVCATCAALGSRDR